MYCLHNHILMFYIAVHCPVSFCIFNAFVLIVICIDVILSGISLPTEQWATFKKSVPAIEEAVKKMESKIR